METFLFTGKWITQVVFPNLGYNKEGSTNALTDTDEHSEINSVKRIGYSVWQSRRICME